MHRAVVLRMAAGESLTNSPPCGNASSSWSDGWPRSKVGRTKAARIRHELAVRGHGPEPFRAALISALSRRDRALITGIKAYRRHPFRRSNDIAPALWREGVATLLDHGGHGAPVLVVPSLVNRSHVLDLLPEASMLRWLAEEAGVRPLLLDWGWPGDVERSFTLTDVVAGRLERALGVAADMSDTGSVAVIGYCMGGLLALAAALRRPDRVRALALLATPWDFWAAGKRQAQAVASLLPALDPVLQATGTLSVDAIQTLFALRDPFAVADKYRAFGRRDPGDARARRFVALEDWLNDGVPLPASIARECLAGWYGANTPARGEWRVAGMPVLPEAWRGPTFLAIPARDLIVPPASAEALAARLPHAAVHRPAAGHIGMVAGAGADAALWRPLRDWLRALG